MSRKSDRRPKPRPVPPPGMRGRPAGEKPSENPRAQAVYPTTRTRLWLMRLALVLLAPLAVLLLTEAALRIVGYGYPVTFFVQSDPAQLVTNDKFAWQFYSKRSVLKPFLFTLPVQKAPGTVRICILGESAAMGTPDPAFSFGRILEAMLRRQYPQKHLEVMNAAMRGINSHVIRLIAQECARHQVDLFIIYMGNNEVVGLHAPRPGSPFWAQSLSLIRAGQWVRSTRLGQFLSQALHSSFEPGDQSMEYFRKDRLRADDLRREKNRENFRANLQDILQAAAGSGAKVILSTVAVNLKDLPPFASLHRTGLAPADLTRWNSDCDSGAEFERSGQFQQAVEKFLSAAQIDGQYAELHYRLGRCYYALQDWEKAKQHFVLARDWDALQFRTDSRLNEVIRTEAASHAGSGVMLLDAEKIFAESELSEHGLPGQKLFYEHVHPTFAGSYLLAQACDKALLSQLGSQLPAPDRKEIPTAGECAEDLAYTLYDDVNVYAAMVRLTAGPPFLDQLDHAQRQAAAEADNQRRLAAFGTQEAQLCLNTYSAAVSRRPDDWPIRFNLALLCQELKRDVQAVEQLQYLVKRFPEVKPFRLELANSLLRSGNKAAALEQLTAALRLNPDDKRLQERVDRLNISASPEPMRHAPAEDLRR